MGRKEYVGGGVGCDFLACDPELAAYPTTLGKGKLLIKEYLKRDITIAGTMYRPSVVV